MATQTDTHLLVSFKNISRTAGISAIVVGCLVLVGWQFDIPMLKSALPRLATMKVNTAIGFILVGASLWRRGNEKSNRQLGILCARPQRGFLESGLTSYFILPFTAGEK
jgi:hypothetical protein